VLAHLNQPLEIKSTKHRIRHSGSDFY